MRTLLAALLPLTACFDPPPPQGPASSSGALTGSSGPTRPGSTGPTSTGLPSSSGVADLTGWMSTGAPTGGPGGAGVYARWELLDNTGTPVEAWVSPRCSDGNSCFVNDFEPYDYDCVSLGYMGNNPTMGFAYGLATGSMASCYENYASWSQHPSIIFWYNATCTQPALFTSLAYYIGGTFYYRPEARATMGNTLYTINGMGTCVENASGELYAVAPPMEVPGNILNILPDAPYEVVISY